MKEKSFLFKKIWNTERLDWAFGKLARTFAEGVRQAKKSGLHRNTDTCNRPWTTIPDDTLQR